jgi:hypothetical protein
MSIKKDYGQAAIDAWYNEIKSYNFATGTSKDGGVIGFVYFIFIVDYITKVNNKIFLNLLS